MGCIAHSLCHPLQSPDVPTITLLEGTVDFCSTKPLEMTPARTTEEVEAVLKLALLVPSRTCGPKRLATKEGLRRSGGRGRPIIT